MLEYFVPNAPLPADQKHLKAINAAAQALSAKLANLDLHSLPISEYNQRYLGNYQQKLREGLLRYAFVLAWALDGIDKPLGEVTLVDHGGGTGMMSMLAREAGIGTIIYSDIYDVSAEDARVIGLGMADLADEYLYGDVDELVEFLSEKDILPDVVASNNVIEHIYDIPHFFRALGQFAQPGLRIAMASGANSRNPRVARQLMASHQEKEQEDREATFGHKERDALRAYHTIRREMIQAHAPQLADEEVEQLATATRELMEPEILAVVDEYVASGKISRQPSHPTNTCDPYTGNWDEHLMDFEWLLGVVNASGFEAEILPGFLNYSGAKAAWKRRVGDLVNLSLKVSGKVGLRWANFFLLTGVRR
jgi:2-polyprenyl-3-methyl-5-hydroxy-6-metoxy-1,4-benzoquinol methylase